MYVAEYRCGPEWGQRPSSGQYAASVMTLSQAGGPNATATSLLSMRQSLAFACLSPEPPPQTGYKLLSGAAQRGYC